MGMFAQRKSSLLLSLATVAPNFLPDTCKSSSLCINALNNATLMLHAFNDYCLAIATSTDIHGYASI